MPKRPLLVWLAAAGATAGFLVLMARTDHSGTPIFGFDALAATQQLQIEERFQTRVSAEDLEADRRFLASGPRLAGSDRDRAVAEWIAREWRTAGLDHVEVVEHRVLLPTAEEPYLAFGASGEASGRVVYAGEGQEQDYEWLSKRGVGVRDRIVIARADGPSAQRSYKALAAEQRGAAGLILFSNPESGAESGSLAHDFLQPGDQSGRVLPKIVAVPMSFADARPILEALGGQEAPRSWAAGLPPASAEGTAGKASYRVGPGRRDAHIRARSDMRTRPIWTVTGRITGAREPDRWIVLGSHRDSWTHGGRDTAGGSAAMMAVARALGQMASHGERPARTLAFASWDAGELAQASSTEWGEQFARELSERAVAYLNVEGGATGPAFTPRAVPALNRLMEEATASILVPGDAPGSLIPLVDAWRHRKLPTASTALGGSSLVNNRLGGGADYAVFLNFLGVPIADLEFSGAHETPGVEYQEALARIWGIVGLRLANAGLLPLDYRALAARMDEYLTEVEREWRSSGHATPALQDFTAARTAQHELADAAERVTTRGLVLLERRDEAAVRTINAALVRAERALLDPAGLPGRPWYRHQVYAPAFAYEPRILPALAAAIEAGDPEAVRREDARLGAALARVAEILKKSVSD